MIESIPQLNPEPQPPRKKQREFVSPAPTPALTCAQIRTVALGFAGFEMLTVLGVWSILLEGRTPWWFIVTGLIATALAAVAACYFLIKLRRRESISPNEPRVILALLLNFLWPAIPTGFIAAGIKPVDPFLFDEMFSGVAGVGIAFMCVLLFHGVPAIVIASSLRRRVGTDDSTWSPHQSTNADRSSALLGMSMMVGGWTAAGGVSAYFAVWEFDGILDPLSVVFGLGALNFVFVGGMFAGFCCSLFSALVPSDTRLDRSVPELFLAVLVVGVLTSAIHPMIGFLAAGATSIAMSFAVRSRHKLIPLGKCQCCAYDLQGLADRRCPECGYEHEPHELA